MSPSDLPSEKINLKLDSRNYIIKRNSVLSKNYSLGVKIGSGELGHVRLAVHQGSGQRRSLKTIYKKNLKTGSHRQNFFNELSAIKSLDHPNIIKLFEYYEDEENYYLVYEYLPGGELFDYILENKSFSEQRAIHFIKQVLSALFYLHSKGLVHCNLKPESLLIDKTAPVPILKLIDFEYSSSFENLSIQLPKHQELMYAAPEVISSASYSEKSDVWSAGVILFILITGKPPFYGENDESLSKNILSSKCSFNGEEWEEVSIETIRFIKKMLEPRVGKRLSSQEALNRAIEIDSVLNSQILKASSLSLDNLRNFQTPKNLQHIILTFIANQLLSKEESIRLYNKFKELDTDCDGMLSCEELFEIYSQTLQEEEVLQEIKKIMQSVDANGSGLIDYSEFLTACADRQTLVQKKNLALAFEAFDLDGNGRINRSELKEMLGTANVDDEVIEKIMSQVDVNKDGDIDLEEFEQIMLNCWT
jgi:calcium-dependent protein kinase